MRWDKKRFLSAHMVQSRRILLKIAAILSFLPAAAWYWLIWSFSSQVADRSGAVSDRLLYSLLEAVSPAFRATGSSAQIASIEVLSFFERKAAHMFLYFVLALLLCFAIQFFTRSIWRRVFLSSLLCAVLAGVDEFHQTMVPGRSGEARDVLVDLCGAVIALGLLALPQLTVRHGRQGKVPLASIFPAVACLLPVFLSVLGTAPITSSPLLSREIARFVTEGEELYLLSLPAALAPIVWDTAYLIASGVAGGCALLTALLAGVRRWTAAAVCATVAVTVFLLAAAGSVDPATAVCMVLLGMLGAGILWALGTVVLPRPQSRST